ncbi:late competence development ComFB family protein [Spirochaeta dissipatitropha]
MKIRNIIEESVIKTVNEIVEEDQNTSNPQYSASEQCRMDAACYVLNRIPPRYISSARGQTYADKESYTNFQFNIDLMALVHEGLRRVTSIQRSYYSNQSSGSVDETGSYYQFPVIKGRILHGLNFEPVSDIEILILIDGNRTEMIDSNWQNPFPISAQADGTYAFWPRPIAADSESKSVPRIFHFQLQIKNPAYENMQHAFQLEIVPEEKNAMDLYSTPDHRIPDLYLVPAE